MPGLCRLTSPKMALRPGIIGSCSAAVPLPSPEDSVQSPPMGHTEISRSLKSALASGEQTSVRLDLSGSCSTKTMPTPLTGDSPRGNSLWSQNRPPWPAQESVSRWRLGRGFGNTNETGSFDGPRPDKHWPEEHLSSGGCLCEGNGRSRRMAPSCAASLLGLSVMDA